MTLESSLRVVTSAPNPADQRHMNEGLPAPKASGGKREYDTENLPAHDFSSRRAGTELCRIRAMQIERHTIRMGTNKSVEPCDAPQKPYPTQTHDAIGT